MIRIRFVGRRYPRAVTTGQQLLQRNFFQMLRPPTGFTGTGQLLPVGGPVDKDSVLKFQQGSGIGQ